jgi:acyl-CoA thioester hydrolase
MELKASKLLDIRFSEVDSMNVVWHGSYMLYFEDARELFGEQYDLSYMGYVRHGYYAPMVEMNIQWKKPILYGMRPRIDIIYRPTVAAKVVFDYEIHDTADESLIATAHSVQVFMDLNYQLVLYSPKFYEEWQQRWKVFETLTIDCNATLSKREH